jgi:glucosylceramidase
MSGQMFVQFNCGLILGIACLPWPNTVALAQSKPVLIQPEIQYQRMDGFGITIGNGSAREIMASPAAERTRLLDAVFGPDGSRLNIIRSEVSWTAKRLPITHPLYLRGFMYYFADEADETAQFNLFREAQKRGDIIWNSCVWTPPPQWKSNQSAKDGGELLPKHYVDFATYLAAYLEFYKNLRYQKIDVLSLQNEPNRSLDTQSCVWNSVQLKALLKEVGKLFAERNIQTKLMLPELAWDQLTAFLQPILGDSEAKGFLSYLGAHSQDGETTELTAVKEFSKRQNFRLWQTEYSLASEEAARGIEGGLRLADRVLMDLSQAECQAWLYWTLLTPENWQGRMGLLDRSESGWKSTKRFSSLAQFSRFVPRNSVRISTVGGSLPLVAFRNPEYTGVILIFVNSTSEPVTESLEMRGWGLQRMVAHRTSEQEDCSVVPLPPQSGSQISLTLAARSITTLVAQIRRIR